MSKDMHPDEWYGTRNVTRENKCGFCRDTFHENCAHEIPWFEKLWVCACECNASWVPKNVTVLRKSKETK